MDLFSDGLLILMRSNRNSNITNNKSKFLSMQKCLLCNNFQNAQLQAIAPYCFFLATYLQYFVYKIRKNHICRVVVTI